MSAKRFTTLTFRTLFATAALTAGLSVASPALAAPGAAGQYLAGRHAEQVGAGAQAMGFYGQAAKDSDLGTADLYRRIHFLALTEGRIGDALQALDDMERLGGKSPYGSLLRALQAIKSENYGSVEAALDEAKLGITPLMAPGIIAWARAGAGNLDGALEALQDKDTQSALQPVFELQAALLEDRAGHTKEAEKHYQVVLQKAGLSLRVAELLGRHHERAGKFENTRELYTKFDGDGSGAVMLAEAEKRRKAGKRPDLDVKTPADGVAEVLLNFAAILQTQTTDERAPILASMALYLRPDLIPAKLIVATGLENAGRYAEANTIYREIPKTSPNSWKARRNMADNLDRLDETDASIRLFKALAKERPARFMPLVELGNVLRHRERYKDAAEAYTDALARITEDAPRFWTVYYTRGIAYEQTKQWAKAEKDFLKALELKPDQPEVLNYLGYSWIDQGLHLERALKMIEQAVDLRPRDGYIVDSLGWGLYRLGKYDEAVRKLERAVQLRPADPVINDHLGDALWRVGRVREARFQWERVLGLEPDEKLAKELDDKLKNGLMPTAKK